MNDHFDFDLLLIDDPEPPEPTLDLRASVLVEAHRRRTARRRTHLYLPGVVLLPLVVLLAAGGFQYARGLDDQAVSSGNPLAVVTGASKQPSANGYAYDQGPSGPIEAGGGGQATPGATPSNPGTSDAGNNLVKPGRKVASSAAITVQTKDLAAAKDQAAQLVRASGGEVFQETTSFGQRGASTLTVKVPPDQFGAILKQLGGLGTLSKQEIRTEDVTQQLVDLDARIRSAEASVTSVAALLEKSTNLIETAQLENELQRRVAELESLRAQNQNLDRRVELATIVLTLETDTGTPAAEAAKATTTTGVKAAPGFAEGFDGGVGAAKGAGRVAAMATGALLPFAPVIIALAVLARWRTRRRFARV